MWDGIVYHSCGRNIDTNSKSSRIGGSLSGRDGHTKWDIAVAEEGVDKPKRNGVLEQAVDMQGRRVGAESKEEML